MNGRVDCLVVVPMKDPAHSKTRLRDTLQPRERRALAQLLFKRTLRVLNKTQNSAQFDLAVVTASVEIADLARQAGASVIPEGRPSSLTEAVECAAEWATKKGYSRLCIIPADLAAPDTNDLVRLINCNASVAICPASDLGTNALLVSPPKAIRFAYGPKSARRHLENAECAGLQSVVMPLESLKFDIDTSACLERAVRNSPDLPKAISQ